MRILVVNVNTTESMTDSIGRQAAAAASPGTEIIALTPLFGADSVEGNYESYLAAIAVMETVRAYTEPFDAVIQAGYGEHGREGLQELLDVPVVDITDVSVSTRSGCSMATAWAIIPPSDAPTTWARSTPRWSSRPTASVAMSEIT